MQSVSFLNITTAFFQHILFSSSQDFSSHLQREFLITIEAMGALRP